MCQCKVRALVLVSVPAFFPLSLTSHPPSHTPLTHTPLPSSGLHSLSDAVKRELAIKHAQAKLANVKVFITPAGAGSGAGAEIGPNTLEITAKEGQTFYNLQQQNRTLSSLMECACGGIAACRFVVNARAGGIIIIMELVKLDSIRFCLHTLTPFSP